MLIRERINGATRYRLGDPDAITIYGEPCHWIHDEVAKEIIPRVSINANFNLVIGSYDARKMTGMYLMKTLPR